MRNKTLILLIILGLASVSSLLCMFPKEASVAGAYILCIQQWATVWPGFLQAAEFPARFMVAASHWAIELPVQLYDFCRD